VWELFHLHQRGRNALMHACALVMGVSYYDAAYWLHACISKLMGCIKDMSRVASLHVSQMQPVFSDVTVTLAVYS